MVSLPQGVASAWRRRKQRCLEWAERRLPALTRLRQAEALPIALGQRRIYILPTRFGLAFAILLLVMLLGALNYGNNAAILLTCLLSATACTSLFFAFRNMTGLNLVGLRGDEGHAGDPLNVHLSWDPGLRDRPSLLCECDGQVTSFALASGVNDQVSISVTLLERGWQPVGRIGIATEYPLGLFRAWSWLNPDARLLVYPRVESDPPPLPFDASPDGGQADAVSEDEFVGLRDYRPNDPPRRIAWKASAHRDELLVHENDRRTGNRVVLDYARLGGLDHEARISRLAAWVLAAEASATPYLLQLPGVDVAAEAGADQRTASLRALALLP